MAFFNLEFIIPVAFLKIPWAPSNTMYRTKVFQSWSFRGAVLFYLFPLPLPQISPECFLSLAFFQKESEETSFQQEQVPE